MKRIIPLRRAGVREKLYAWAKVSCEQGAVTMEELANTGYLAVRHVGRLPGSSFRIHMEGVP
jgi:hypothetical protein